MKKRVLFLALTSAAMINSSTFAVFKNGSNEEMTGLRIKQALTATAMKFQEGGRTFQATTKKPVNLDYLESRLSQTFLGSWDSSEKVWKFHKGQRAEGYQDPMSPDFRRYLTFFDFSVKEINESTK